MILKDSKWKFWVILSGILLLFAALRWPLLNVPMERDEGEYATIGLGMLHGIPPYSDSYTMKLPGAASLHALIFLCLGPTARAIHVALLMVNTVTIFLIACLGRRLLGMGGGLFAAAAYGTFTLGMGMFGIWLSAEHFAALFLVGGAYFISFLFSESTWESTSVFKQRIEIACFFGGAFLLGTSILIKQHAALPAVTWLILSIWFLFVKKSVIPVRKTALMGVIAGFIFILPLILTCGIMSLCGVFKSFQFWTLQYASEYVTAVPLSLGWEYFKINLPKIFLDAPLLWIFSVGGFCILLLKPPAGSAQSTRILLLITFIAAVVAASAGLMFRGQYFILVAPYAALLAGVTWKTLSAFAQDYGCQIMDMRERITLRSLVRRRVQLRRISAEVSSKDPRRKAGELQFEVRVLKQIRLLMGITVIFTSFIGLAEPFLFGLLKRPDQICRLIYGMNPFPEYQIVADYIRKETRSDEKVAVIGSEPAIYFLSDRRPALPYLCVYEMMKPHAFSKVMQNEAVRCMERTHPHCVVMVNLPTSWGIKPGADLYFIQWIEGYLLQNYKLDGMIDLISESKTVFKWGKEAQSYTPQSPYTLMIFKWKD